MSNTIDGYTLRPLSYTNLLMYDASGNLVGIRNGLRNGSGADFNFSESTGAGLVGFIQSGTGSVATNLQVRGRQVVYVTDFAADGVSGAKVDPTGAVDSTLGIQAFRDFIAGNATRYRGVFPSGIYLYTVSPNWAIANADIVADGEVRMRYTGVGEALIFDGGAATTAVFNANFTGRFIVEAAATARNGVYARALHHSNIVARVASCGTGFAALRTEFSVGSTYDVRPTGNEGWYAGGAIPTTGYHLTRRDVGELTSGCVFPCPIIEGVSGDGMYLDYAIKNEFIGGTSEGSGGIGVHCTANSSFNSFWGINLEVNTGGGIKDAGDSNSYTDCLNDGSTTIDAGARTTRFTGGIYDAIVDNGAGTILDNVHYGSSAGTISGTGTHRTKRNVFSISGGALESDQSSSSLAETITNCANGVATTVLTLPSTGNQFYRVKAWLPLAGAASFYGAYADIYQDQATAKILSQVDGTALAITLVGQDVKVTQTSGLAQNITAVATAI